MRLVLRQTLATAIVQKGTRSTPGTSLARNEGRNSQCQPSRRVIASATPTSSRSSAGENAPSTNRGKTASWSASATIATNIAALNGGPGEMVMESSGMVVPVRPFHFRLTREGKSLRRAPGSPPFENREESGIPASAALVAAGRDPLADLVFDRKPLRHRTQKLRGQGKRLHFQRYGEVRAGLQEAVDP